MFRNYLSVCIIMVMGGGEGLDFGPSYFDQSVCYRQIHFDRAFGNFDLKNVLVSRR